jgi:hypothetical protein
MNVKMHQGSTLSLSVSLSSSSSSRQSAHMRERNITNIMLIGRVVECERPGWCFPGAFMNNSVDASGIGSAHLKARMFFLLLHVDDAGGNVPMESIPKK